MQVIEQDSLAARCGFRGHEFIVDELGGGGLQVRVQGGKRDGEKHHFAGNPEYLSEKSAVLEVHNTAHTDERLGRMAKRPAESVNAQNLAAVDATGRRADDALSSLDARPSS